MAAPIELDSSRRYTLAFVNQTFNSDVKSLSKVKETYNEFKARQELLEKQLSLASSEAPNEIERAIKDAERARLDIQVLGEKKEKLRHAILDESHAVEPVLNEVKKVTEDVRELEKLSSYLAYVIRIDGLSTQLQTEMMTDCLGDCVNTFLELSELYTLLQTSACSNLVTFIRDTTIFWFKKLQDKLAKDFEEVLKQMNWPVVAKAMKGPVTTNPAEIKSRMEKLFKQLIMLEPPSSLKAEVLIVNPHLSSIPGLRLPILPVLLMIMPLKKRFKYHFYGNKQTNDIGKPEWYFSQVLSWIRDHNDFLTSNIQPLLKDAGKDVSARQEFMLGMLIFVMEKMVKDLPSLENDEHQFSHLVDESLLFDREIRNSYGYSSVLPGSLHVLTRVKTFDRWIKIEKKFALEKLDAMMSSPTAWESQYKNIADVDELKVPECGESFMTLMLTITDRYKPLPDKAHKLQFLDLQLELLEDFRVRLVQVKDTTQNALSGCFCSILNTAYYVAEVLQEWNELVFFVELQYYKMKMGEAESLLGTDLANDLMVSDKDELPFGYTAIFDDIISLYDRLRQDMMKAVVNHVFTDVRARSKPYRDDKWSTMHYQKDVTLGLSTSACEMLLVLKDHLLEVEELISKPLFNQFWQKMAEKLNTFIYRELIERNKFNQGGGAQLQFDMVRNLFPLFGEYTPKPESYFREVKEACILLNMSVGSGILLKNLLKEALHQTSPRPEKVAETQAALHDVGVFKLTLDQSELILSLRTNLIT